MEPQEGCRPFFSKRRGQLSDVDELSVLARSSIKVYGQFDSVCVVKKDEKKYLCQEFAQLLTGALVMQHGLGRGWHVYLFPPGWSTSHATLWR